MVSVVVKKGWIDNVKEVTKVKTIDNIRKIGGPNIDDGVHIASFPCPTVDDVGLTNAQKIQDVVAKAAATLAALRAMKAARLQDKIARRYYDIAHKQWEHFFKHYRPLEEKELAELHLMGDKVETDYESAIKGHDCTDTVFDNLETNHERLRRMFCMCLDVSAVMELELARSTIRGDSHNFARRYAESRKDKLDDLRFNRKLAAAGRGRGLLSESARFGSEAAKLYGEYSNAMSGFSSQALNYSGYLRHRRETKYNGEHTNRVGTRLGNSTPEHYQGSVSSWDPNRQRWVYGQGTRIPKVTYTSEGISSDFINDVGGSGVDVGYGFIDGVNTGGFFNPTQA